MIPYQYARQWIKVVHALAITETQENEFSVGDGGQAFSLLQQHPPFFSQWYPRSKPSDIDTWTIAEIKACATYLDWAVPRFTISGAVQAYNVGVSAYRRGVRNPSYLIRFTTAYNSLGGTINEIPLGGLLRRAKGAMLRSIWDTQHPDAAAL